MLHEVVPIAIRVATIISVIFLSYLSSPSSHLDISQMLWLFHQNIIFFVNFFSQFPHIIRNNSALQSYCELCVSKLVKRLHIIWDMKRGTSVCHFLFHPLIANIFGWCSSLCISYCIRKLSYQIDSHLISSHPAIFLRHICSKFTLISSSYMINKNYSVHLSQPYYSTCTRP